MGLNLVVGKKEYFYLFLVNFLFLFYYLIWVSPHKDFYYDSHNYFWGLSSSFINKETFSLLHFNETLRGLMFPLLNYWIIEFAKSIEANPVNIYKIFSAFYLSILTVVVIPAFLSKITNRQPKIWQVILLSILTFVFWRGYYAFPLTDFLSVTFLIIGLHSWLSSKTYASFITGAAFAIAINLRPAYLLVFLIFGLWIVVELLTKKIDLKKTLLKACYLAIAFLFISSPQIYVNKVNHGTFSPLVQTAKYYSDGGDLFLQQLRWGVLIEKYETNIGVEYPDAGVRFFSKAGITKEESEAISDYGKYFDSFFENPLGYLTLYIKHTFNALDIIYADPYILNIYDTGFVLPFLNYTLIFLFGLIIAKSFSYDIRNLFLVFIFVSPCLLSIPTAIEVRFFLPIHLLIYVTIAFFDYSKLSSFPFKTKLVKYSAIYLVFVTSCFILSYNTYLNLEYPAKEVLKK